PLVSLLRSSRPTSLSWRMTTSLLFSSTTLFRSPFALLRGLLGLLGRGEGHVAPGGVGEPVLGLPRHREQQSLAGATCPSPRPSRDRKSTRLNSSHVSISYAVFCLKKKKKRSILD